MRKLILVPALLAILALAAACSGDDNGKTTKLGSTTFNDHGTADLSGKQTADLEVDNYYFEPTFIRGKPGDKITLNIKNDSGTKHNFTLSAQKADTDIDAKGKATVEVTIPPSGVLKFFCEYHTNQGMNGELLSGDTAPAAPPAQ